eukprot:8407734-Alexandrium_andersonii.AAC.1
MKQMWSTVASSNKWAEASLTVKSDQIDGPSANPAAYHLFLCQLNKFSGVRASRSKQFPV